MSSFRKITRMDGTALVVRCYSWHPICGFIRPHGPGEEDVHDDDYEPVLQLLAQCTARSVSCAPYIVVVEIRRDGQAADSPTFIDAHSFDEIVESLNAFPIQQMVPYANAGQSLRLVRHFRESVTRFLSDIRAEFDLDLQNEEHGDNVNE